VALEPTTIPGEGSTGATTNPSDSLVTGDIVRVASTGIGIWTRRFFVPLFK